MSFVPGFQKALTSPQLAAFKRPQTVHFLGGRRKSIQPMAERLPDGTMQALQQFVTQSRSACMRPRTPRPACPLELELFLPEPWADDVRRCQAAGVPDGVGHVAKSQLGLGLLDRPAGWLRSVPVIAADASYGRSVCFRRALEERGWSQVMAVDPKEGVESEAAAPYQRPLRRAGATHPALLPHIPSRANPSINRQAGRDPGSPQVHTTAMI